MDAKIAQKVLRYVELSSKFSKSWNDLYPNDKQTSGTLRISSLPNYSINDGPYISSSMSNTLMVSGNFVVNGKEIYVDEQGNVKAKDAKTEWTRADDIRAQAEIKATISDEFDEYNKLKYELKEYFEALRKISE
jgi:hypothetical protein